MFLRFKTKYVKYFNDNVVRFKDGKIMLDTLPRVLLVENFGLFTIGRTAKACRVAADIYEHTVPVIASAISLGSKYTPVTIPHLFDCEYWELEQAKVYSFFNYHFKYKSILFNYP